MSTRYRVSTPRTRPAAIAAIDLYADDPTDHPTVLHKAAFQLGFRPPPTGTIALRDIAGIDHAVVAAWTDRHLTLMPHGGPAVIDAILATLQQAGATELCPDPTTRYPEAADPIEAHALAALAESPSPLAVDLLLSQPARWRAMRPAAETPRDRRLRRLLHPPTIAVVGPPNVGKSSLLNTLAGRELAATCNAPGTTRDHIGATINLAGLAVRWIDCPGLRTDAPPEQAETAAARLAVQAAAGADLLVAAGDSGSCDPKSVCRAAGLREPEFTLAVRADLGPPDWPHDHAAAAKTGQGITRLVAALRETLVPEADLRSDAPWVFDPRLLDLG
ncbi:MAG: GTPase [Planctomycetota bacterium]